MTAVLIVDDSKTSRMMMKHWVLDAMPGTTVVEAACGEDALKILAESAEFDWAIVDYNMGGMNGLDFVHQVAPKLAPNRIVLCTANIQDIIRERASSLGVFYMAKPVTAAKIRQVIGEMGI